MDTDITVTEAEIAEEAELQTEAKEDEIREKLVTELGVEDNEDNKNLIDKMVAREMDNRNRLSKAVGQKIKYRNLATGKQPPAVKKSPSDKTVDPVQLVQEQFMQRDLDELEHSDKIKEEIKKIATLQNISIRKAEKDSYIQHLIGEEEKEKKIDNAATNGKNKTKAGTVIDISKPLNPADFNLATEEGRAEWEEAKKARREATKS